MAMMKAAVIHSAGGPEVLKIESLPIPQPRHDEVLIRVKVLRSLLRWMRSQPRVAPCRTNEQYWSVTTLIRKNHLWFTRVAFQFSTYLDVLRQSSAACKALQILKSGVLKRLRSG
jgi:hypothetical protein